jgi:Leucine-rich repeat (LRR) protein
MLESKVKERIAEWENRKSQNSKLPAHKRLDESDIQLDLSGCEIRDVGFILELDDVFNVNLSNNLIEDISPLANCKDLVFLMLTDNLIKDALPLINLRKLRFVNIDNNKIPLIYGKQKAMIRDALPDAQIFWDSRLRTPNLFG